MPREGSSDIYRKLPRHQACHRCRKRKLKCDGSVPCEGCRRAHAYELKTRPATAAAGPKCEYDDPDIVSDGPKGKITRLEAQIAKLQTLLEAANARLSRCSCGASSASLELFPLARHSEGATYYPSRPVTTSVTTSMTREPLSSVGTVPVARPTSDRMIVAPPPIEAFLLHPSPWNTGSPPLPDFLFYTNAIPPQEIPRETFEVCLSSWPLNIPPPAVLYHLVETFFTSVPLANRLIHKPTFMVGLRQVPTSPDFPHVALLHAICGLASIYSPIITDTRTEPRGAGFTSGSFNSAIVFRPYADEGVQGKHYFPKSLDDIIDVGEEGFGAAHIRWAAASLRLSVREGDRLLQLLQAAIICTWYTYSMGMTIAVYTWIGSVTRLVGPIGVYASEGFEPLSRLPSNMLFLLGKPRNPIEAETIRNAFWVTYVMERIYNAGTAWPLTITDEDISQMMPCRFSDFEAGERVPTHGRQRLFTENMLLTHPPLTTDSWTLYIKGTILISKVRSFNCRYRIVMASPNKVPSEGTLGESAPDVCPLDSGEFGHLEQTIAAFVSEMPRGFREPMGTTVDPILYMAHLLPHVAMIQLHDPHARIDSPNDHSAMQMLTAAREILELLYKVCGTAYDLLYMDHGCSFCWFVAGAALVRFLKFKKEVNDEEDVARLEQELGVVRFMLRNLGQRAIIGLRQSKLLEEIYDLEIKGCGPRPAQQFPAPKDC